MAAFTMNEALSLFIGVEEEVPSFSAIAGVAMLTGSLQCCYLLQPSSDELGSVSGWPRAV
ncbi:hypothetical protein BZM27_37350 [Paraburkholderia steynii]|uniref:Uncharacterized protein n=1 Tax=Paraburkholderia steynii TaxID=1245441 RepID=A0A4R0XB99_9BURK|nr:hypothetical protein BZM27_37350 [Paraburkholderia steynii]